MHQDPAHRPSLDTLKLELGAMISAYHAGSHLHLEDRGPALAEYKSSMEQVSQSQPGTGAGAGAGYASSRLALAVEDAPHLQHQHPQQPPQPQEQHGAGGGGINRTGSFSGHMQKRSWQDRGFSVMMSPGHWVRGITDVEAWADLSGKHRPQLDVPGELLDVTACTAATAVPAAEQVVHQEATSNQEQQDAPPEAAQRSTAAPQPLLPTSPFGLPSACTGNDWQSNNQEAVMPPGWRPSGRSPQTSGGQQPDLVAGSTPAVHFAAQWQYTAAEAVRQDEISCQGAALVAMVLEARAALHRRPSATSQPRRPAARGVTWGRHVQVQYSTGGSDNGTEGMIDPLLARFSQPVDSGDEVLLPSDDSSF
jgi:hypothetical protein